MKVKEIVKNPLSNTKATRKILNFFVAMLSILSVFCLISNYSELSSKEKAYIERYNKLLQTSIDYNSIVKQEALGGKDLEKPIFNDDLDCILTSFNNYLNCKSYTMLATGTMSATAHIAGGIDYYVLINTTAGKWADGFKTNETSRYQVKGFYIDLSGAAYTYNDNGQQYVKDANSVSNNNGVLIPNYGNNSFRYSGEKELEPLMYEITEEYITEIINYRVNYNIKGKIVSYTASFKLDFNAVVEYGKSLKSWGGFPEEPIFKNLVLTIETDPNGNMIEFKVSETFKCIYTILSAMEIDVTCNWKYVISNYNKTPTIPKPII